MTQYMLTIVSCLYLDSLLFLFHLWKPCFLISTSTKDELESSYYSVIETNDRSRFSTACVVATVGAEWWEMSVGICLNVDSLYLSTFYFIIDYQSTEMNRINCIRALMHCDDVQKHPLLSNLRDIFMYHFR